MKSLRIFVICLLLFQVSPVTAASSSPQPGYTSELLATYLLHKLKWELLGKTVLLLATIVYQARRVVPTLKEFVLVCQHQQVDARVDVTVMMRATGTRPFTDI